VARPTLIRAFASSASPGRRGASGQSGPAGSGESVPGGQGGPGEPASNGGAGSDAGPIEIYADALSGDLSVDDSGMAGVIDEDRLGLDRVYVQAKRYAATTTVGRPEVQGFVGILVGLGATKGVFVTTSGSSQNAVDLVQRLSQRVILIDGQRLADLLIEHNVGVRISRTVEFKRLDEDFFTEEN